MPIWGGGHSTYVNKIDFLQKKAIRLICNLNYLAHVHLAAYEHKLLLMPELFIFQLMKLMHDVYYNNGAMKYNLITNIFDFVNVPMGIRSRNNVSFLLHYAKTVLRKNSVFLRGIAEWNNLPINIRSRSRAISFKNDLCKYLLKSYN